MADRKKLELALNQPCSIELLYDQPTTGQSQYGEYYLYAIRNGDGVSEFSYFAPAEVHSTLKEYKKGARFKLTKIAEQKGSKIVTKYEVEPIAVNVAPPIVVPVADNNVRPQAIDSTIKQDNLFEIMLQSCRDAVRIQNELGGMLDVKSIAVSLFIARSK